MNEKEALDEMRKRHWDRTSAGFLTLVGPLNGEFVEVWGQGTTLVDAVKAALEVEKANEKKRS